MTGTKSYMEIQNDIELKLRERVKDFLNYQFQSVHDNDDIDMTP